MSGSSSRKTKSSKSTSSQKHSTRDRSLQILRDMERNPSLSFTQACLNRNIDPRTVESHVGPALRRDSSGRIKLRKSDKLRQILYIPSAEPGKEIPVATSNSSERQLLGRWMAALNYGDSGNYIFVNL
jgi:hypothetical protein